MISIIVCCYNSAARLPRTIEAIRRAELGPVGELIIVDNNSRDATMAVAGRLTADFPVPVVLVSEARQGLAYARAAGIARARGDIVSFLDDDNEVFPDWFGRVARAFASDPRIGATGGRILPPDGPGLPDWFPTVSANFAVGQQAPGSGYVTRPRMLLWGAGLSVRRTAVGDFYDDPDRILLVGRNGRQLLAGDDTELCYWLVLQGYELYYDGEMVLRHNFDPSRLSLNYLMRINVGFGRARCRFLSYHQALGKGRISRYPAFQSRPALAVLGLADLGLRALRLVAAPRAKSLAALANAWGYLSELRRYRPRPLRRPDRAL